MLNFKKISSWSVNKVYILKRRALLKRYNGQSHTIILQFKKIVFKFFNLQGLHFSNLYTFWRNTSREVVFFGFLTNSDLKIKIKINLSAKKTQFQKKI